jgi:hypothetical protein
MYNHPYPYPLGPLLRRVEPPRSVDPTADLSLEHAALVRWLGQLQRRMAALQLAHRQQVAALEAELVRLRGQTVALRTATLWGLGERHPPRALDTAKAPGFRQPPLWPEASAVICQTGCVGHGHPWLGNNGLCRRTGEVCRAAAGADASASGTDTSEGHRP